MCKAADHMKNAPNLLRRTELSVERKTELVQTLTLFNMSVHHCQKTIIYKSIIGHLEIAENKFNFHNK